DGRAGLVDDRARFRREPVSAEERAVVVTGEEARLLALGPVRGLEPRTRRLGTRLHLRLLAEREPDALEVTRVEPREHVALVLRLVGSAGEQQPAVALDDAGVVAGCEVCCAGALRERQQLGEAEAAVAADARVR